MKFSPRRALPVLLAAFMLLPGAAVANGRATHSLRAPLTDENFYFVMADRFDNGDTANDLGGLPTIGWSVRLRPDRQGLLQRR